MSNQAIKIYTQQQIKLMSQRVRDRAREHYRRLRAEALQKSP